MVQPGNLWSAEAEAGYGDHHARAGAGARAQEEPAAAFIVEPIQGEGGIVVPQAGYLKSAWELCHRNGVLFVAGEVQTGFGRTGRMFGVDHEGVEPDIMALARALGGGVAPIGTCIATGRVWQRAYGSRDTCMLHDSTFGGNALAFTGASADPSGFRGCARR